MPVVLLLLVALLAGPGCAPVSPAPADVHDAIPRSAAGALVGRVVDGEGDVVAGAAVATEPHGYEATADAGGIFAFARVPPGEYRVRAAAEGYESGWSDGVAVAAETEASVTVALSAADDEGGRVEVTVHGPDDGPWAGVSVVAGSATAVTDEAGEAVLEGLGGQTVDVVVDPGTAGWSRRYAGVEVPAAGGAQLEVLLSGRPPEGARATGGDICALCHEEEGAAHAGTAHAAAMSGVEGGLADAFEAGEAVDLGAALALLGTVDGDPVVTLVTPSGDSVDLVVGGVIGGRSGVPWAEVGDQAWPLPFAWVAENEARPGYAEAGLAAWGTDTWFDGSGERVDLDPARSADAACFACHATGFSATARADGGVDLVADDADGRWNEGAVSCEHCHGPGSGHSGGPLSDKPFTITNPARLDADRANEVCGQCHAGVAGTGTGVPWPLSTDGAYQPGEALADYAGSTSSPWPSGAARAAGEQADELARSPHGTGGSWTMRCTDCHAPHGEDGHAGSTRVEFRDNTLCLSCHEALTFDGDVGAAEDHTAHIYDPSDRMEMGRCTGCHMPPTAARVAFDDFSGAGDLASHLFLALSPAETLAAFDDAGTDTLPVGSFPVHACSDCHGWNEVLWDSFGATFPGTHGDPTERATHEAFLDAYQGKFP